MIVSIDTEILKSAYTTILNQRNQLVMFGQNTQDCMATLLLLKQSLQQAGEYQFIQQMENKLNNPYF